MATADRIVPSAVRIFAARLSGFPPPDAGSGALPGRVRAGRSEELLRRLLSRFTGIAPERLPIGRGCWGKPLLPESFGLWFNLSHSADRCLVAVARFPVGIDLEADVPRRDPVGLARRFLPAEEAAVVAAAPPAERTLSFLRAWTKREAFLKGCGTGLFRSPRSFRLVRRDGSPWEEVDPPEPEGARWAVRSLDCGAGFVGALAVSHRSPDAVVPTIEEISAADPAFDPVPTLSVDAKD